MLGLKSVFNIRQLAHRTSGQQILREVLLFREEGAIVWTVVDMQDSLKRWIKLKRSMPTER